MGVPKTVPTFIIASLNAHALSIKQYVVKYYAPFDRVCR
jgi:hypothetical protein